MANKFKYMKRVFSGKTIPVIGLDQGKGILYRGNGVNSIFNLIYGTSMVVRDGQEKCNSFDDGINTGDKLIHARVIGEGTNLWASDNG